MTEPEKFSSSEASIEQLLFTSCTLFAMNITAYIYAIDNFPIDEYEVCALLGFKQLGVPVRFFETIEQVPLNENVLVVGPIEDTKAWFAAMEFDLPGPMTMPSELNYFAGRPIQLMTYKQAQALNDFPFFIKPYSGHKQFEARVINGSADFAEMPADLPAETIVLRSDVTQFITEYRGYVIDKQLVGLKHYGGDLFVVPSADIVRQAIHSYNSQPAAYAIDFGVEKHGRTILVECNDFWSLDSYELEPRLYVRGLITRWTEILSQNSVVR